MDELHQLHDAITKLWNVIKKYNDNLPDQADEFLTELENIKFENHDIANLFGDWAVKYMNYVDKKEKKR